MPIVLDDAAGVALVWPATGLVLLVGRGIAGGVWTWRGRVVAIVSAGVA